MVGFLLLVSWKARVVVAWLLASVVILLVVVCCESGQLLVAFIGPVIDCVSDCRCCWSSLMVVIACS